MPVDKFGRMSDAKTRDTRVSLTNINNKYIRSDGSSPVSSSIDMKGNTLYNVSNPVNPQDVTMEEYVDTANKAFIFDDGRYMATNDLSMGGRRLNNVGMPVKKHQASIKFYVETVIESATTGNKALRKIRDGIFRIETTPLIKKNYVDNGGAIVKLPNGAFTTVSDIDFDGFSLKNIPDPIDGKDAVNKDYVDGRIIYPSVPSI